MELTVRRRLLISGRVQGVYFRDSTCVQAIAQNVNGWVRNLPDGRVEAVLEGENAAIERIIDWCHSGPPNSRVVGVEIIEEPVSGESGFMIR